MKKFLVFGGEHYYARGGWQDLKGECDTLDEAVAIGRLKGNDWWHVVNTETRAIVTGSLSQSYGGNSLPIEIAS